jgi:hypothetical protein
VVVLVCEPRIVGLAAMTKPARLNGLRHGEVPIFAAGGGSRIRTLGPPSEGDNLRRNLALVEELKALAAALAARQISAGYAAKGGWGAVMARFIGATTDQGATHDQQGAPHQALGAITRAAPLFSTRLRWLCPATTRSFTRGPLASSLVMSASYQTDQNRKWQGPSHLPSSKRGDALSPAPVQLDA